MKKWFWNCKVSASVREDENIPLVEYNLPFFSENEVTKFMERNDMLSYGAELMKIDAWWTDDCNKNYPFGWNWTPDPNLWPNGMTAGNIIHSHGLQFTLYMGNQFQNKNLADPVNRENQKTTLIERFDNWHFDYWRTDFDFEAPRDYLIHEGFLEVVDYMIANRGFPVGGSFRLEICSLAGR